MLGTAPGVKLLSYRNNGFNAIWSRCVCTYMGALNSYIHKTFISKFKGQIKDVKLCICLAFLHTLVVFITDAAILEMNRVSDLEQHT